MSTLSQFGSAGGGIKSIQTITRTQNQTLVYSFTYTIRRYSLSWKTNGVNSGEDTYIDVTIDPVDPNKTILITDVSISGRSKGAQFQIAASFIPTNGLHYAELINSTTLRIQGPSTLYESTNGEFGYPATMRVQIVEFN